MADDRRLLARLAAAEQSLREERLPPRAVRRIANRIAHELDRPSVSRRLGFIPMLTFVAGAALVLLFLAWTRLGDNGDEPAALTPVAAQDWARVSGPDCHQQEHDGEGIAIAGACEVIAAEPAMRIQTVEEAELDVEPRVVKMRRGSALFDVDHVVGEPVRVEVPGGEIVVVGTRFRVVVTGNRGQVDLYEGKLEFHDDDGNVSPILAGEQFAFARAVEHAQAPRAPQLAAAPTVETTSAPTGTMMKTRSDSTPRARPRIEPEAVPEPKPEPKPEPTPPPEPTPAAAPAEPRAGAIIEEVQRLRRSGEYERAADHLRSALKQRWPTRTADVLSYELGSILARHLHDASRACEHWRAHLERFRATRYRRQVEASISSLGCP